MPPPQPLNVVSPDSLIGAELGVALRTIKTHRARVMQKMGVVSVAELVGLAQKAGIAPAPRPQGPKASARGVSSVRTGTWISIRC
jgi:hypothetical protein